jgi:F0F1-type ATP synthase membrane subunit c/vacuolar-type H+-ATPase subunit K
MDDLIIRPVETLDEYRTAPRNPAPDSSYGKCRGLCASAYRRMMIRRNLMDKSASHMGVGVALGLALDNLALGIAMGIAIGAGLTTYDRRRDSGDE